MSENMTMEVNSLTANEVEFEALVKGYLKQVDEDIAAVPPVDENSQEYRLPYEVDINFSVATAGVKYFGLSLYNHATRLDVGFEVMNKAEMALREREDKIKELKKAYKRVIRKMNKQIENAKQDEDFVQKATAIVAEEVEAFRKSHQLSPYAEQVHTAGNFVPMLTDGIIGAFLYPSEDMIRKSAKDAVMNYIART